MNFKIETAKDNKKYVWINDVKLEQGLKTIYDKSDKKFLILDSDSKDFQGNDYNSKIEFEDKTYGIVQSIDAEAIIALAELTKILRTL